MAVSLAHASQRIWRHKFLQPQDRIWLPKAHAITASEAAFHGPRIRRFVPQGWYKKTWELDVNGAYAWAMAQLPSPLEGSYRWVRQVPNGEHGVICISGTTTDPRGLLLNHRGDPITGDFTEVWTTVYEVEELLRSGTLDLKSAQGYVYTSRAARNPFRAFAEHCWARKLAAAPHSFDGLAHKVMPNALWGKMGSVRSGTETANIGKDREVTIDRTHRMSQMYHPFFAALIPGMVRARMHELEEKYDALTTSTDAIRTQTRPDPADIGTTMGTLKVAQYGDCCILDDRLVYHRSATGGKARASYHGFKKDMDELLRVAELRLAGKEATTTVRRMYSIRQAARMRSRNVIPMEIRIEPMNVTA